MLGGVEPDDIELAERLRADRRPTPRPRSRSWRSARSSTRTTPACPRTSTLTLNCRYVYRPPFELPDIERKFGNLTLTYATQIHACVVEIDPETGVYEIVDYAAVDDCGNRINPQIVEGQVMGATAHAIGAATHETFAYDEDGNLLTPNFYDYHVPHALDMPPLKTGCDRVARRRSRRSARRAWARAAARASTRSAPRSRTRCEPRGGADRLRQLQPVPPGLGAAPRPGASRERRRGGVRVKVEGERTFDAPREASGTSSTTRRRWRRLMPGVESFEVQDDRALDARR